MLLSVSYNNMPTQMENYTYNSTINVKFVKLINLSYLTANFCQFYKILWECILLFYRNMKQEVTFVAYEVNKTQNVETSRIYSNISKCFKFQLKS